MVGACWVEKVCLDQRKATQCVKLTDWLKQSAGGDVQLDLTVLIINTGEESSP